MTLMQQPTGLPDWDPTDTDLERLDPQNLVRDGDRDSARLITRVQLAAERRLMGMTWQQVADHVGYASKGAAFTAVMGYLRRQADETVAALREQESARLDRAGAALWAKVLGGDARAQDTWLRNRASFRALHGLNAPIQVTLSSGAQAALADALADAEALMQSLVAGEVVDRVDEPAPEDAPRWDGS